MIRTTLCGTAILVVLTACGRPETLSPHPATPAEALRVWMKRENLTQARAAKRLGIAQPRVSEIMRGKVELMSLNYLVGLRAKAGIPVGVRLAA